MFCTDDDPPKIFDTSLTSLYNLYDYLVPKSDDATEIDTARSQVTFITSKIT